MVAKSLETGDLVWAKMKGYPSWPGKIVDPPNTASTSKSKKYQHFVFFFGSQNYAWIPDENIVLHNDKLVEESTKKKHPATFLDAVETIVKESAKHQKESETSTSRLSSSSKEESPKSKSSHPSSISRLSSSSSKEESPKSKSSHLNNISDKEAKKKEYTRKALKKVIKKRRHSPDRNGNESRHSSKRLNTDENFTRLIANLPPNNDVHSESDDTAVQSTGILGLKYKELPPSPKIDFTKKHKNLESKNIIPTTKKIGFLGLGKVACGLVANLVHSGHSVIVWDSNPEKRLPLIEIGAEEAETPCDAVIKSDITFCCVSDSDTAKNLFFENYGGLKGFDGCEKGKGYVEMTSIHPSTSKSIADAIEGRGGRYLEAQFIGSVQEAESGSLLILAAGDSSLFDDCHTCFQAIGRESLLTGNSVEVASKLNIIHGMLLGTVYAALAESLALSQRIGLQQADFMHILNYGIFNSETIINKAKCMVDSNYMANTPLRHIQENINFGLMLGSAAEQPLPITAAANEVYKHCKLLRYADHDVSAIYEGTLR